MAGEVSGDDGGESVDVRVVDAIAIAMTGGFLSGVLVTVGYGREMVAVFLLGVAALVVTLVLTYVRLNGVPPKEELTDPRELLEDVLVRRRD